MSYLSCMTCVSIMYDLCLCHTHTKCDTHVLHVCMCYIHTCHVWHVSICYILYAPHRAFLANTARPKTYQQPVLLSCKTEAGGHVIYKYWYIYIYICTRTTSRQQVVDHFMCFLLFHFSHTFPPCVFSFCQKHKPPAPMNHAKYLRAGPAEMPFRNWYTANTNHSHLTESVRWKWKTQPDWVIKPVTHDLVRRIRFWRIKISGTWF